MESAQTYVEWQKDHADTKKHGSAMRTLLKQLGRRRKYEKWRREDTKETRMEYKKSRQNAKRVISSAKEKKQKECANDLNDSKCQNEIFRMDKQMVKKDRIYM